MALESLLSRLESEKVPPVPRDENNVVPLQAAPSLAVPPVPRVPRQKWKGETNFTKSPNVPPDLTTLANGLAKEFGVNPVQALELLDDDDRAMIQAGDQATIDAWRCAVESRVRRGEWGSKPPALTVIANTSAGRCSVDMVMPAGLPAPTKAITEALPKAAVVRFRLENGEGGGALICPDGIEEAHQELMRRYGDRLQEMNP